MLIIIVVMSILLFKTCGDGSDIKNHADELNKKNDSLIAKMAIVGKISDSVAAKNSIDSLKSAVKFDSLSKVIVVQNAAFEKTRATLIGLKHQLDSADKNKDTTDFYAACREISNQLTEANNQLFQIQISNDSLSNAKNEEIQRLHGVIAEVQSELAQFKVAFAEEINTNKQLTSDIEKLARKAKKTSLLTKIGWGLAAIFGAGLIIK